MFHCGIDRKTFEESDDVSAEVALSIAVTPLYAPLLRLCLEIGNQAV